MTKQKLIYKGVKYEIITYPIDSGSNYNTAIHIRQIGQKTPFAGGNMKHTDNVKQRAIHIIDTQVNIII